MAAIVQAYSISLIVERKKRGLDTLVFITTIVFSFAYMCRLLYLYEDEYLPYNFSFSFLGFS